MLADIQRKIASLLNIHDITVCLIGRPAKYHLLLYPASLHAEPPRLKFVIHISFGQNFGTNAQKVHDLYKRFLLLVLLWVQPLFLPLEPDCLSERTLPLVLVVKNVETISPWTDSSHFEKLPRQILQPAKLADCEPKAGTLPGTNGAFQTSESASNTMPLTVFCKESVSCHGNHC